MGIKLRLLGDVNKANRTANNPSLAPKYIATIKASELALYLRYRRIGKKTPFKLDFDSLITVDPDIQRGLIPETGNLRQEEKKINEIRDSLLGVFPENPTVFLGTLVWNIRPPARGEVLVLQREGRPLEYEIEIQAEKVWLTDSAHRHIGICEAVKTAAVEPSKYPRFNKDYEFPVEIYNLDITGEKALFKELNSKQKKITATKAQQVDATSKVGRLKSRIIELDQANGGRRLLYQNIEVNSNQNDRHTLLTMSLLSASIREMFGTKVINDSAEDEDLREQLADHFLKYLYKLSDEITIVCNLRDKETAVHPFTNLYLEKILPTEEETADFDEEIIEKRLKAVRDEANALNKAIREQDKTHSNPVFKALARVGGYIRFMPNWDKVVENFQSRFMASNGGRYFQASNSEILEPRPSGVLIATRNDDGKSINIQVVSQVVQEINDLMLEKLGLTFEERLFVEKDSGNLHPLSSKSGYSVSVNRSGRTYVDLRLEFDVGALFTPEKSMIRLRVASEMPNGNAAWAEVERKGGNRLMPVKFARIEGYEHPDYSTGIARYFATFELDWPEFKLAHTGPFCIKLTAEFPGFDGQTVERNFILACQVD